MRNPDHSRHNNLLAALMASAGKHFYSSMELVALNKDDVLYESESRIRYAYFPTTAIISLACLMEDGDTSEIASVGNEGVIGVPLFMGSETTHNKAIVRSPGYAFRLKGALLLEEFNRSPAIQLLLLRYTQSLFAQISQIAACNRHHAVSQQLCRWLLVDMDRQASNTLEITHESIANLLGVRRESISKEAYTLQNAGIINYSRGHITVVDRKRLEAHSCECYKCIRKESARLLQIDPSTVAPLSFRFGSEKETHATTGEKTPHRNFSNTYEVQLR